MSPCSLLKAPLKFNTEQQGQEGLSHSCVRLSVFLPKAGSARTCVISDGTLPILSVFPFSLTFLTASAVFSMSFFLLGNAFTYFSEESYLISCKLSLCYGKSVSFSIFFIALWETYCFSASPICICWIYRVSA